ncbi:MAG: cellulose-binding domain-containing protein [Gammaproteobacteria bacterium]
MKFSSALDIARYCAQVFLRLIVGVFQVLFTLTFSFLLLPSVAWTATPAGTVINNRAQVIYTLGGIGSVSTSSNVDQFTISALNTGVNATLGIATPSGAFSAGNSTILNITITNPSSNPLTGGHLTFATPAGSTLQLLSGAGVVSSGNGYSIPDIIANGSLVLSIRLTVPLTQPPGNLAVPISYQATGLSPVSSNTSLAIKARTRSKIEFLQYDATGNAPPTPVGITQFANSSGAIEDIPAPTLPGGGNIHVTDQAVSLMPASGYHKGQTIFIRVSDPDRNADSNTVETIDVNVTDIQMGDSETLRLKETGPDTGIFTGYVASTTAQTIMNNGSLSVTTNDKITIRYADNIDNTDAATVSVLVDPYGVVFNSSTGQPVNGVEVRFINSDTGLPAVVFGDDGVSSYPATVITGGQVADSSGAVYQFPAGSYRFPLSTPGNYRLEVKLPNSSGYTWPSSAATSAIQSLPGAPFAIDIGSRSEVFSLQAGPPLRLDLPIDPLQTPLFVRKAANKSLVANGDFLQYGIDIENTTSLVSVPSVELVDLLPHGFRYQSGSTKINNIAAADPLILPDGRTLKFMLGDLAPGTRANLSYVVEVAVAPLGKSTNQATAQSNGVSRSNLAEAAVDVREDLMRSRSILMGRVIVTEPGVTVTDDVKNNNGLAGVRIYLEDGSFAVSDKRGMFHFEGIRPGTHVVQLDLDTVPEKYEVIPFEENTRSAGRAWSKFIDVQGGTMWRVDFHVALKPRQEGNVTLKMDSTPHEGEHIQSYKLEVTTHPRLS